LVNFGFTKEAKIMKVKPFHSKKPGTEVYHDDNKCMEGNNIETYYLTPGTGGLRKCSRCRKLSG
jgi:hypothetical protein